MVSVSAVVVVILVLAMMAELTRGVDRSDGTGAPDRPSPRPGTPVVVLEDGRAFDEREWEAVERAHLYLAANPEACVDDLLFDVRPLARCGRLSPRAWWADVVARGLAAETEVDLDAVRGRERATPSAALRERASDISWRPFGDAPAFRSTCPTTRLRDEQTFGATLPGAFSVGDVNVADRRVLVEGAGNRAAFEVVDRDGDLAVAPGSDAYRRESAEGQKAAWYVDAAAALESVLPARFDALQGADSPWPTADDALDGEREDESVPVVAPVVRGPSVDAFDCTVHEPPDPAAGNEAGTGDVSVTAGGTRAMVDVAADGDRAALLVTDDGVVRFTSTDDRSAHDLHWATRAVAAADAAVHDD